MRWPRRSRDAEGDPAGTSSEAGSGLRAVLVADDDEMVRRLASAALRRSGFEVLLAADGLEAEQLLGNPDVLVAVLDWEMPGRTGIELCRAIKVRSPLQPRVVMLTGMTEEPKVVAGFEAGADEYVTKPFDPRELVRLVRSLADVVSDGPAA